VAKPWHTLPKSHWPSAPGPSHAASEWRRQEARETLQEIAQQEGLEWLVREVLSMVKTGE
jgi:hypothetical protein